MPMPPLGIWGHLGVWGLSGPCLRRRSAARRTQPVSAGQRQLSGLCWGRADTQPGILHQEPGENGARQPVPREMTGGEEPRGGAGPGLTSVLAAWPLGASVSSSVKGATPRSYGGGAPRPEGLQSCRSVARRPPLRPSPPTAGGGESGTSALTPRGGGLRSRRLPVASPAAAGPAPATEAICQRVQGWGAPGTRRRSRDAGPGLCVQGPGWERGGAHRHPCRVCGTPRPCRVRGRQRLRGRPGPGSGVKEGLHAGGGQSGLRRALGRGTACRDDRPGSAPAPAPARASPSPGGTPGLGCHPSRRTP